MVGVAGKSRGCKPCRQRKLGCDKQQPRCGRCISTGRSCGGYDHSQTFINVTSNNPHPTWNRVTSAQQYQFASLRLNSIDREEPPKSPFPTWPCSSENVSCTLVASPIRQPLNLAPDNIYGMAQLFTDLFVGDPRRPKRMPRLNMTDIKLPGSWVDQISSWVGCSKVLDTAIAALATAFIGCRRRDTQLIHSGTASYTTALRLLRDAVARPDANDRDDLIATALVMTMIEIFMPAEGGAGWQSHVEGCCMLLNTRGQKTGTTPFTNDLILIARYQGLYGALCARKEFFFSKAERHRGMNAPITLLNTSRNIFFDAWCEIILPLPSILKQADDLEEAFSSDSVTNVAVIKSLLDSISETEHDIGIWRESVIATVPAPIEYAHPPVPPATGEDVENIGTQYDILFPNPLEFASIEVAILHLLYWAIQLLIHSTRNQLLKHLPSEAHPKQPLDDKSSLFASLICRSVHYCFSDTSTLSTEEILMPLYVSMDYFTRTGDEEKMRWGVKMFERLEREDRKSVV